MDQPHCEVFPLGLVELGALGGDHGSEFEGRRRGEYFRVERGQVGLAAASAAG